MISKKYIFLLTSYRNYVIVAFMLVSIWVRFLEHCEGNETQHMYYKIIYNFNEAHIIWFTLCTLFLFCLCYFFCTPYRYIYQNINRYFIFGLLLH